MKIDVTKLKQILKEDKIPNVYLFYGEEKYLLNSYVKKMTDKAINGGVEEFNLDVFDEKSADFDLLKAAAYAYPQMAPNRIAICKNTDFLHNDSMKKAVTGFFEKLPETTYIIFVEEDLRKVKKDLLKYIENNGCVVNFEKQSPATLTKWINQRVISQGKKISSADAQYLAEICNLSLSYIDLECGKLIASLGERDVITRKDIDNMVPVSAEYKIFSLINYLLDKKSDLAYELLNEMKMHGDMPTEVINAIYSQFSVIYMCKKLAYERKNPAEFLPPNRQFLAQKYGRTHTRYSEEYLRNVMKLCAKYDIGIKTGQIEPFTALEIIMAYILDKN